MEDGPPGTPPWIRDTGAFYLTRGLERELRGPLCLVELPLRRPARTLSQPLVAVFTHELVISQMGVGPRDSGNLIRLAGREVLMGIQAPPAGEQSLPTQNLVNPWNAPGKGMPDIENGRVGVGHLGIPGQ